MKTKLEMAHDWMMKHDDGSMSVEVVVFKAWQYADAMQAEADKRSKAEVEQKRKAVREMLNADNTFLEKEGQHFDDVEEWQPDWSQAPDWANWWCLSVMHGAMWFSREPICTKATWAMLNDVKFCAASFDEAPSFNYQGNWQDSLRKRPQ